jgi:hypothetical protein
MSEMIGVRTPTSAYIIHVLPTELGSQDIDEKEKQNDVIILVLANIVFFGFSSGKFLCLDLVSINLSHLIRPHDATSQDFIGSLMTLETKNSSF